MQHGRTAERTRRVVGVAGEDPRRDLRWVSVALGNECIGQPEGWKRSTRTQPGGARARWTGCARLGRLGARRQWWGGAWVAQVNQLGDWVDPTGLRPLGYPSV